MPLDDDLDRKFAAYTQQHALAPPDRLDFARARAAETGQAASAVLIQSMAPPARPKLLAILRFLHAGFPATEEDALDRHEDRLVARLALKSGALDEATLRTAIAEQDSLRAQGTMRRLGEILVARGTVDPQAAERLYRYLENAIILCEACFASTTRQGLTPGSRIACHRCGGELVVPSSQEKPSWTEMAREPAPEPQAGIGQPSDLAVAAAQDVADEAAKGESSIGAPVQGDPDEPPQVSSSAVKGTAKPKRVRPKLAPQAPPKLPLKKKLAAVAAFAVPACIVGPIVLWAFERQGSLEDFERFKQEITAAVKWKHDERDFGQAKPHYDQGLAFTAPHEKGLLFKYKGKQKEEIDAAKADQKAVDDFLRREKDDQAGELLGDLVSASDLDVLMHLADVLATKRGEKVGEALAKLASHPDEGVRKHTFEVAVKVGPEAAPALEVFIKPETGQDEAQARAAAQALAKSGGPKTDAGLGAILAAVARFGKEDSKLVLDLEDSLIRSKDPRAIELLKKLAHDKRSTVSEKAILGLANSGAKGLVDELILGLDAQESVQKPCVQALKAQGTSAIGPLENALASGQTTALLGLVAMGPEAEAAFTRAFPKLGWIARGNALSTVKGSGMSSPMGKSVVKKMCEEALALAEKLENGEKVEDGYSRVVLAQMAEGADAFGLKELADRLSFEFRYVLLTEQHPASFSKWLETEDLEDPKATPFVIVKNHLEGPVAIWFKGEGTRVLVRAVADKGADRKDLAPGNYKVVADAYEADGTTARYVGFTEILIVPGKRYSVTFGEDMGGK